MSANPPAAEAHPAQPSAKRLRVIGLVVLVLGLLGAGAVYWIRTHTGEPTEDELLAGNARAEAHQMGVLYGKMGLITQELSDDLKQPGTQSCFIAGISILIAAGCFHFARLEDDDDQAG
jgi:flagellar basal body-associated protein FliL